MKQFFTFLAAVLLTASTYAQVGIGTETPDASSALDITSTTKGLLIPRMTKTERDAISSAAKGLIVFNTTLNTLQINEGDATTANWVILSSATTSPTYTVNTFYAELGGYVIEVNSDGTHGLVVAMQDQGTSNWYQANDLLSNANNHSTNGAKFKDWRLPAKRELNLMYGIYSGNNEANLKSNYYWSSTETVYDNAWSQYFYFGNQDANFKSSAYNVRAVRAF
jgi:hypothetical protein